jgi:hypothetical protein
MQQVPKAPVSSSSTEVTETDVFDQPWKYTGYKKYSWFLASDDDFLIFRRFGTLNARVTLVLQDEISERESKLKDLDEQYSLKNAPRLHNGSFRHEKNEALQKERRDLVLEIKDKLKEYSAFLISEFSTKETVNIWVR